MASNISRESSNPIRPLAQEEVQFGSSWNEGVGTRGWVALANALPPALQRLTAYGQWADGWAGAGPAVQALVDAVPRCPALVQLSVDELPDEQAKDALLAAGRPGLDILVE